MRIRCWSALHPTPQAELLDDIENDAATLAYLEAALYSFIFEDVTGLVLAVIRMGIDSLTTSQLLTGLQYTFSVLMCGFTLCNTRNFIQISGKVAQKQKVLGDVLERASTSLDAFEGIDPRELSLVIRLRGILASTLSFEKYARDVLGDLMLLRRVRELFPGRKQRGGAGAADESVAEEAATAAALVSASVAVTDSLAKREQSGADAIREQILRKDLASGVSFVDFSDSSPQQTKVANQTQTGDLESNQQILSRLLL